MFSQMFLLEAFSQIWSAMLKLVRGLLKRMGCVTNITFGFAVSVRQFYRNATTTLNG